MSYLSQLASAASLSLVLLAATTLQAAETMAGTEPQDQTGIHSKSMDQKIQERSAAGASEEAAEEGQKQGGIQSKIQANEQKLQMEMEHGNTSQPSESSATEEEVKPGTTQQNLENAYSGEKKARKEYEAFAKKADEEDYPQVADLFRAASVAEGIHAKNHVMAMKKMGIEPKESEMKEPEVKSTKDNLEALKGETREAEKMYPAFYKVAKQDNNKEAMQTFEYARDVEKEHAKLFKKSLGDLDKMKGKKGEPYYVCPICGYTVAKADKTFERCPVSQTPASEFMEVMKDNMASLVEKAKGMGQ